MSELRSLKTEVEGTKQENVSIKAKMEDIEQENAFIKTALESQRQSISNAFQRISSKVGVIEETAQELRRELALLSSKFKSLD